jgi:adenylate kinase family enzyme
MTRKIHIFGGPGSGKSFIASAISRRFEIPHLDLDDLFWDQAKGYGTKADEETRNMRLNAFMDQRGWVIEGVYYAWLSRSFQQADVIVMLQTSVWLRHWRIIRRFVRRKLGFEEHSKQESLRSLIDLIKYNHAFDNGQMKRARKAMSTHNARIVTAKDLQGVLDALQGL